MRIFLTAVTFAIVTVKLCAQTGGQHRASPLACDRLALSPDARTRHFDELEPQLLAARTGLRELPNGYALRLPADAKTIQLVAEWAAGERLCCPFFDMDIRLEPEGGPLWLTLTGRDGTKDVIAANASWLETPSNVAVAPEPAIASSPAYRDVIGAWVANAEREIVGAADAMPEDEYSFAPTQGEFRGVRTFAQQVTHLAAANYQLAAAILHERPPHGEQNETAPASVKTKAEVMEYVRGSFAYLHRAAATIASENAVT